MSWEAWAYLLLAAVLAGGFAWFERSRPPARIVALVAALAALAVAGRLVLAPVPNVVATTDIVLITGLALGAAPGFAVGALAALISNVWLGQGPWTPWEMAGWGMVGLLGSALGAVTRGRIGRIGLAVACGLAGLAYGALLDLSVMVSYGGEQSLDRYLAISARGIPFNIAHAAGNVVFALAAGPALVRVIARYRERFEFRWHPAAPLAIVAAVAGLAAVAPARAEASGSAAAAWLQRVQNPDGGFGIAPGSSSSATMTGWAVLGLEAAGRSPFATRGGGPTPIAYLRARIAHVRSTGDLERTILALEGAGVDSRHVKGRNLPRELRRHRASGGSFGGQVNLTAYGILALRAAGTAHAGVRRPARWLRAAQNGDGGWGFQSSAPSDADSTGAALQGLAAAGGARKTMRRGVAYLRRTQRRDGGFALGGGGLTNSQSTAWAIQGLVAAGANPARVRNHGHSPFDYLSRRQRSDGHYAYSASSDQTPVWVTGQALAAVERAAYPLQPVPRPPRRHAGAHHAGGGVDGAPAAKPSPAGSAPAPSPTHSGGGSKHGAPSPPAGEAGGTGSSGGGARGAPASGPGARAAGGAAEPASAPAEPAAAVMPGDGGSDTTVYVLAGLGALILALAAGFLWYRRRLP